MDEYPHFPTVDGLDWTLPFRRYRIDGLDEAGRAVLQRVIQRRWTMQRPTHPAVIRWRETNHNQPALEGSNQ